MLKIRPDGVRKWRDNDQAVYLATTWCTFQHCSTLGLAMDASRLMEPAKECLLSALWAPEQGVAQVGHLQVLKDFNDNIPGQSETAAGQIAGELDWEDKLRQYVLAHPKAPPAEHKKNVNRLSNMDYLVKVDRIISSAECRRG
ncbi:unnamed protein product [Prorocentrum cordatum]|uniref:Uncharacterized protein n=1 Tax=Prorocentrum cordatum TaxID=2364126 RepID=A0ABN9Q0Y7_9DINO|nr:unnamed protein product [Polarella glacialis]